MKVHWQFLLFLCVAGGQRCSLCSMGRRRASRTECLPGNGHDFLGFAFTNLWGEKKHYRNTVICFFCFFVCVLNFITIELISCSEQISQQATGQEIGGWDWLGVGEQEQPIRWETGDPESANSLAAWDTQSVSPKFQGSYQARVHINLSSGSGFF